MKLVLVLVIICGFVECVNCGTGDEAKSLRQTLFVTNGYDKKIRPQANQTEPLLVYVNFYLLTINSLDEVTETMKTTGYLWILWNDDFLQWDPSLYGGIDEYHWPQDDVWKPDIALKNSFLEYKQLGVDTLNVYVHSSGNVEWQPFQVFQSTCAVDITYYPYDIQTCQMKFVAWSYTKKEVIIESGAKGIDLYEYETNSEWNVVDTSYKVEWDSYEAAIVFTLKIQRKPTYVLLSVLMPIIMLAILNISVFLLPCESGEKASYAVTVFLAFAVFLSIISSTLPENSDSVAFFSMYLIVLTLQSTLITLMALVLIRVSSFDSPVPGKLLSFIDCVTLRKWRNRNKVSGEKNNVDNMELAANTKFSSNKSEEANEGNKFDKRENTKDEILSIEDSTSEPDRTWKNVVNAFDKICFVFFAGMLAVSTIIFFIVTSTNK